MPAQMGCYAFICERVGTVRYAYVRSLKEAACSRERMEGFFFLVCLHASGSCAAAEANARGDERKGDQPFKQD